VSAYDFDEVIDRRSTFCEKWSVYSPDVVPLWVADMDFRAPDPVIAALHRRVEFGVFGYPAYPHRLCEAVAARLQLLYGWAVAPEACVPLPGVIPGLNLACRACAAPGDAVVVFTPVYTPILRAPGTAGLRRIDVALVSGIDLRYEIDFDALEASLTADTRLLFLCNPHNPVGRTFTAGELERLAEICCERDILICSDEIHSDLIYAGHRHTPIAALSPAAAARTITLMAPSKTFNMPGLKCAFAVIPDAELRARFQSARAGLVSEVNLLGVEAALAAYESGEEWLSACLSYLQDNRDYVQSFVREQLPRVRCMPPEATYLAWLDCRALDLEGGPYRFFLEKARVALSDGEIYGPGGEGFVRLNFACPRSILTEGLQRMVVALSNMPHKPSGTRTEDCG